MSMNNNPGQIPGDGTARTSYGGIEERTRGRHTERLVQSAKLLFLAAHGLAIVLAGLKVRSYEQVCLMRDANARYEILSGSGGGGTRPIVGLTAIDGGPPDNIASDADEATSTSSAPVRERDEGIATHARKRKPAGAEQIQAQQESKIASAGRVESESLRLAPPPAAASTSTATLTYLLERPAPTSRLQDDATALTAPRQQNIAAAAPVEAIVWTQKQDQEQQQELQKLQTVEPTTAGAEEGSPREQSGVVSQLLDSGVASSLTTSGSPMSMTRVAPHDGGAPTYSSSASGGAGGDATTAGRATSWATVFLPIFAFYPVGAVLLFLSWFLSCDYMKSCLRERRPQLLGSPDNPSLLTEVLPKIVVGILSVFFLLVTLIAEISICHLLTKELPLTWTTSSSEVAGGVTCDPEASKVKDGNLVVTIPIHVTTWTLLACAIAALYGILLRRRSLVAWVSLYIALTLILVQLHYVPVTIKWFPLLALLAIITTNFGVRLHEIASILTKEETLLRVSEVVIGAALFLLLLIFNVAGSMLNLGHGLAAIGVGVILAAAVRARLAVLSATNRLDVRLVRLATLEHS